MVGYSLGELWDTHLVSGGVGYSLGEWWDTYLACELISLCACVCTNLGGRQSSATQRAMKFDSKVAASGVSSTRSGSFSSRRSNAEDNIKKIQFLQYLNAEENRWFTDDS